MIEKILSRLQKRMDYLTDAFTGKDYQKDLEYLHKIHEVEHIKEIVQEVAKDGGWIPCSERLPQDFKGVLITAIALNGTSYTEIGKWNGEQWFHCASNTRIDIAEVIAWQPLPAPYQKGE